MLSKYFDHATPAQVVVQVFGGHSVEASHPFFQPRVVGVRILDVVDAGQDSDPLVEIHRPMGHGLPRRWGLFLPRPSKGRHPGPAGVPVPL